MFSSYYIASLFFMLFSVCLSSTILQTPLNQNLCSQNFLKVSQKCWPIVENCLIYLQESQCQVCYDGYILNQTNKCVQINGNGQFKRSSRFQIKSNINSEQILVINRIQQIFLKSNPEIVRPIQSHILIQKASQRKFYRIIFELVNGFSQYLVLSQQNQGNKEIQEVYPIAGKIILGYPLNTRSLMDTSLDQYQYLNQKITQLSPFLSKRPFAILQVLWNIGNIAQGLVVYIFQEEIGLIQLTIYLEQNNYQLFKQQIQIDKQIENLKISDLYNIGPSLYSTTFIVNEVTIFANFSLSSNQFTMTSESSLKQTLQNKIQKYFQQNNYAPSQICPNKIPLYSSVKKILRLYEQIDVNQFIQSQTFRQIRKYIISCYPQYSRNQLQTAALSVTQNGVRYIYIVYTTFITSTALQVAMLFLQNVQQQYLNLIKIVTVPKDMISTKQLSKEQQIYSKLSKIVQKEVPQMSVRYQELKQFTWTKFQVNKQRTQASIYINQIDSQYSYVKVLIDMAGDDQQVTILYTIREQFEVVQNFNGYIAYFNNLIRNLIMSENQNQQYLFFKSKTRDYYLLTYLVSGQLKVYELGVIKELRSINFKILSSDQQIQAFIKYGVIIEQQEQIQPNISQKPINQNILLQEMIRILKEYKQLVSNQIINGIQRSCFKSLEICNYEVRASLKNGDNYKLQLECISSPLKCNLLSLQNQQQLFLVSNQFEKTDSDSVIQMEYLQHFKYIIADTANIIKYEVLNSSQNLYKILAFTKNEGLIYILAKINTNTKNKAQIMKIRTLDNGYTKIGLNNISLIYQNIDVYTKMRALIIQYVTESPQCELILWKMKYFTIEIFSIEAIFTCNIRFQPIKIQYSGTIKDQLFRQYSYIDLDFSQLMRQYNILKSQARSNIQFDQKFIDVRQKLEQQYKHFLSPSNIEQIQSTRLQNVSSILYKIVYSTPTQLLQGIVLYSEIQQIANVLSLAPLPVFISYKPDVIYISKIMQFFDLPKEYNSILLSSSPITAPSRICLFNSWMLCVY